MSELLEKINTDTNKEAISVKEITKALESGFFDTQENITAMIQELDHIDNTLERSCVQSLLKVAYTQLLYDKLQQYPELMKRLQVWSQEQYMNNLSLDEKKIGGLSLISLPKKPEDVTITTLSKYINTANTLPEHHDMLVKVLQEQMKLLNQLCPDKKSLLDMTWNSKKNGLDAPVLKFKTLQQLSDRIKKEAQVRKEYEAMKSTSLKQIDPGKLSKDVLKLWTITKLSTFPTELKTLDTESAFAKFLQKNQNDVFYGPILQQYVGIRLQPYIRKEGPVEYVSASIDTENPELIAYVRGTIFGNKYIGETAGAYKNYKEQQQNLAKFHLTGATAEQIATFQRKRNNHQARIKPEYLKKIQDEEDRTIAQIRATSRRNSRADGGAAATAGALMAASGKVDKYIYDSVLTLTKDYVTLLLQTPEGKKLLKEKKYIDNPFMPGMRLNFAKGNVDSIVRDSFLEKFGDGIDDFKKAWEEGRREEVGRSIGSLVGGTVAAGATTILTGGSGIWAAGAAFTVGSRAGGSLGGMIGAGFEGKSWSEIGNAGLVGLGVGERDQNGTFVNYFKDAKGNVTQDSLLHGAGRMGISLGTDYLSSVATFGIGNKIGLDKWAGKFVGAGWKQFASQGAVFGAEELFIENFLVDIPANTLQAGVSSFFLGNAIQDVGPRSAKLSQNTNTNKQIDPNNPTATQWDIKAALGAMATTFSQNISPENLGQTFAATLAYGGMLSGGRSAINKVAVALPALSVKNINELSTSYQSHLSDLQMKFPTLQVGKEMKSLTLDGKILDQTHPRFGELEGSLKALQVLGKSFTDEMDKISQIQQGLTDPSSPEAKKRGLIYGWKLLHPRMTPLEVMDGRITKLKKEITTEKNATKKSQKEALLQQMENVRKSLVAENKNDSDGVGVQTNPGNIETSNKNQINIPQDIQTANSLNSDKLIHADRSINLDAKAHLESFLRTQKVLSEKATLTDEQIRKIYEVHTMNRNPGEIDDVQLNIRKGRALRTIFDETMTRTLMEGKVCGEIKNDISLIQSNVDTTIGQIKDFNVYINDTFVYQSLEESFHNFRYIQNTIDNLYANIDENINKLLELHKDQPAIYEEIMLLNNSLTNRFNEISPIIHNLQSLLKQNYEIMSQNGMRENLQQSIIAQQGKLYAYAQSLSHEISLLQTSLSNNVNEINTRISTHQSTENDSTLELLPQLDISTITTHYPDLLKNIINPETLQTIIQSEIALGNLVLNTDGSIKEVYTEVGGEKKPSQLFEKMKADGFGEQKALKTWLQVRTPEFKNRFGDRTSSNKSQVSKVVDENGEPLVVYHGTFAENFNEFDPSHKYGSEEAGWGGSFFSTKIKKASMYGMPNVYFINMKNTQGVTDIGLKPNKSLDGLYEKAYVGYDTSIAASEEMIVFDPKNIKSAIDNDGSFSPETAKFNDYFGKESRFGFDSKQARDHSTFMDQFSGQATVEQITQIRQKIEAVAQMYADKTGKKLDLTDVQIQAIIDTHLLPGQLGKLTQVELLTKNKKLAEAIPDADLRRFLLEAGFCGKRENIYRKEYEFTINKFGGITLGNMANDLENIKKDISQEYRNGPNEILYNYDIFNKDNIRLLAQYIPEISLKELLENRGVSKTNTIFANKIDASNLQDIVLSVGSQGILSEGIAHIIMNNKPYKHMISFLNEIGINLSVLNDLDFVERLEPHIFPYIKFNKHLLPGTPIAKDIINFIDTYINPIFSKKVIENKEHYMVKQEDILIGSVDGVNIYVNKDNIDLKDIGTLGDISDKIIVGYGEKGVLSKKSLVLTENIIGSIDHSLSSHRSDRSKEIRDGNTDAIANTVREEQEGFDYTFNRGDIVHLKRFTGLNGEDLYIVTSNGNHRVSAAKKIGLSHTLAEIQDFNNNEYFITKDQDTIQHRSDCINKGYIDGKIIQDIDGSYKLYFTKLAFDGIQMNKKDIEGYVNQYTQITGRQIPQSIKDTIEDLGIKNY